MNLYLKDWHHLKITEITMQMVVGKHAEISQTNKSHANITLKLFSAIYNYHRKRLTNNNQPLITEFSPVQILYQNDLFNKLKPRKIISTVNNKQIGYQRSFKPNGEEMKKRMNMGI